MGAKGIGMGAKGKRRKWREMEGGNLFYDGQTKNFLFNYYFFNIIL